MAHARVSAITTSVTEYNTFHQKPECWSFKYPICLRKVLVLILTYLTNLTFYNSLEHLPPTSQENSSFTLRDTENLKNCNLDYISVLYNFSWFLLPNILWRAIAYLIFYLISDHEKSPFSSHRWVRNLKSWSRFCKSIWWNFIRIKGLVS